MLPNIRSMLLFWRFCPMNAPRHLGNRVRVLSQAIRQAHRPQADGSRSDRPAVVHSPLSLGSARTRSYTPRTSKSASISSHPTVSGLLQRLEGKGFLTCEPGPRRPALQARHSDRKVRRLPEANLGTHSVDRGADDRWDERTRNRYAGAASGHGRAESGCVHEF